MESSSEKTSPFKNIQDIYEVTKNQNDLTLFCFLTSCEPISFEAGIQDQIVKDVMDREIKVIKKIKI